ncbi:succinate dehydrogenase, cytochrome b556 subunit [Fulvimarina sp. 2208YS6-2-32]|uniref:Succinate dehydrogenase cytochrome b556 subunit n=1 Tax=Fulvimarina uroteuthidis TaxID=3098149 RepID=A0ABU5I5U1_9HYPH|nr:succinate dehydrogenase, cytochrome b556 subunit [Fulvimarina sp. 2208YS6-2-32]MDY8110576.1 succinate dehydrogenase, cytochrome b556 subunit [Fulvimarina sp. 2208YS6-2-32]
MSDVKSKRPLSPHLTIYRFKATMTMSILHRITGSALYFGTILVVWWLAAAASGPDAYASARSFFGNFFIQIILIAYSWALIHHALGGIRHLIWDTGHGLSKETSTRFAQATIAGSLVLTVLLWLGIWLFA